MIPQQVNNVHWNYLQALDADALVLSRYIEFSPENYNTFSIELARLLMAAASEVDVVAKIACEHAGAREASGINSYREVLTERWPNLAGSQVEIARFGMQLTPWENWRTGSNPDWWRSYNQVKHERHNHYGQANLQNALNAVGGLFVMLLYAFPEEAESGRL